MNGAQDWNQLCLDAAMGPACALCLAPNGEVLRDEALQAVVLAALKDAVAVARRCGAHLSYREQEKALLRLCAKKPRAWHPLAARLRAKKPSQASAMLAPLLAAAKKTKAPAPFLLRLLRLLRRLEKTA